jgi:hypothetical protein
MMTVKYQLGKNGDAIRYIASVDSVDRYGAVGWLFSIKDSTPELNELDVVEKRSITVYTSLLANGVEKTTSDVYGDVDYSKYFYVFEITDIPEADADTVIYVRPYVEMEDGRIVTTADQAGTTALRKTTDNEYTFGIWYGDIENWEECSIGNVYISKGGNGLGVLYAEEIGIDEDEDDYEAYWNGYQDVYSLTSSDIPKPVFKTDNKLYYAIDSDGGVDITFGANGVVTASEPGVLWGKSQLLPIEYDAYSGIVTASLWLMGYDDWEDCTFGAEFILSIPVSRDGTAKASEITIQEVRPGPNW